MFIKYVYVKMSCANQLEVQSENILHTLGRSSIEDHCWHLNYAALPAKTPSKSFGLKTMFKVHFLFEYCFCLHV